MDMFGSPSSCSQLQPTNSQLPTNNTLSLPASPPGTGHISAAAACSDIGSLQVQHTGGSDCSGGSLAAAQPMAGFGSSGSMQAPQVCSPLMQPLPPVTMVFMAVEGPEQLVRRRRTFTPRVQVLLSRVVRDALRRLGGYLCRVQEGDMKFMVAFASPVTALEWCLLVQVSGLRVGGTSPVGYAWLVQLTCPPVAEARLNGCSCPVGLQPACRRTGAV